MIKPPKHEEYTPGDSVCDILAKAARNTIKDLNYWRGLYLRENKRKHDLLNCLLHLQNRDWYRDGVTGDVTCILDADKVRAAIQKATSIGEQ